MRTTLDIADDVLFAAKEIARREKKTLGETISDLARRSLTAPAQASIGQRGVSEELGAYGIHPLPARGGVVSNEMIDRLRDEEGV